MSCVSPFAECVGSEAGGAATDVILRGDTSASGLSSGTRSRRDRGDWGSTGRCAWICLRGCTDGTHRGWPPAWQHTRPPWCHGIPWHNCAGDVVHGPLAHFRSEVGALARRRHRPLRGRPGCALKGHRLSRRRDRFSTTFASISTVSGDVCLDAVRDGAQQLPYQQRQAAEHAQVRQARPVHRARFSSPPASRARRSAPPPRPSPRSGRNRPATSGHRPASPGR